MNTPATVIHPLAVVLFIIAHVLVVSAMGLVAARVGEHYKDREIYSSHYMRLIPLNQTGSSPK